MSGKVETEDAEEMEIYRQEALFAKKKNTLHKWLAKLEEHSLQAEKDGDYSTVNSYDFCKQVLEVILRVIIAQECDPSYLGEKGLALQVRKEVLEAFSPSSRKDIASLLNL
jgi:hypothetical protein